MASLARHTANLMLRNQNPPPATAVVVDCLRRRCFGNTPSRGMPMKAGTELTNLAIFKGKDVPVTLERSEYPEWVNDLATPQPSLAALRKIPNEEADLDQIKRYLKLTRRQAIRQRNEESAT